MRRMTVMTLIVLGLAACSSSSSTGTQSQSAATPDVTISQLTKVARNIDSRSGLPVDYRITVQNPLDHEITLTAVEIETVGQSGAYNLKRVRHRFDKPIAAHATATLDVRAWVTTLYATEVGEVSGPVSIRGLARFSSPNGDLQSTFSDRVQ